MKRYTLLTSIFLLTCLSGCSVVEGIFKAGVWSGILIVVLIVGIIIFIISKMSGR